MNWQEVRKHYPDAWLLVEALTAHTENGRRLIDDYAVLSTFPDSVVAFREYTKRHQEMPIREFYVLHTSRESVDIIERPRRGFRGLR